MNTETTTIPTETAAPLPPRLLRLPEVLERTGMGRTNLRARVKAGTFPEPCKLGTLDAWVEAEVTAWIQDRIRERDDSKRPGGTVGGTGTSSRTET